MNISKERQEKYFDYLKKAKKENFRIDEILSFKQFEERKQRSTFDIVVIVILLYILAFLILKFAEIT